MSLKLRGNLWCLFFGPQFRNCKNISQKNFNIPGTLILLISYFQSIYNVHVWANCEQSDLCKETNSEALIIKYDLLPSKAGACSGVCPGALSTGLFSAVCRASAEQEVERSRRRASLQRTQPRTAGGGQSTCSHTIRVHQYFASVIIMIFN